MAVHPFHEFESAHYNEDPEHPDAICVAVLKTANHQEHGYEMSIQCGHKLFEHQDHTPRGCRNAVAAHVATN